MRPHHFHVWRQSCLCMLSFPAGFFNPCAMNDLRSLVVEGLSAELANHNQRAVVAEYRARRSCSCKLAVFLRFDVVRDRKSVV